MIEDKVFERIGYIRKTKHFSMYRLAKEADIPYQSISFHTSLVANVQLLPCHTDTFRDTLCTASQLQKHLPL